MGGKVVEFYSTYNTLGVRLSINLVTIYSFAASFNVRVMRWDLFLFLSNYLLLTYKKQCRMGLTIDTVMD